MTASREPLILFTGFGPFPGAPTNPSATLARALARLSRPALAGTRRVVRILPTRWDVVAALPRDFDALAPDIVLMIGLAARRKQVCIEGLGRNHTRLLPDASGRRPEGPSLAPGDAASFRCTAKPAPLLAALRRNGVPTRLSSDAGGYVCNALSYHAYGWATSKRSLPLAVFVHIPRPRRRGPLSTGHLTRALGDLTLALRHEFRVAAAR